MKIWRVENAVGIQATREKQILPTEISVGKSNKRKIKQNHPLY